MKNPRKSVGIRGKSWKFVEIRGNQWKSVKKNRKTKSVKFPFELDFVGLRWRALYLGHFFTYVPYVIKNWHSSFCAHETNDRGLKKLSIYAYPFIFTSYFLLFCFFLSAVLFDSIFGTFWYHEKAKYGFELSINVHMIENSQNISKNQFI